MRAPCDGRRRPGASSLCRTSGSCPRCRTRAAGRRRGRCPRAVAGRRRRECRGPGGGRRPATRPCRRPPARPGIDEGSCGERSRGHREPSWTFRTLARALGRWVLVVPRPQLDPLVVAELPARVADLGEFLEVPLTWWARREQDEHGRRLATGVMECVDAARRYVNEVARLGIQPGSALEQPKPFVGQATGRDKTHLGAGAHRQLRYAAYHAAHRAGLADILRV